MKKLIFILFTICSIAASAQTIEDTAQLFWQATENKNNQDIIKNGQFVIDYLEKNNEKIDTISIYFYIITAIAYSNNNDFEKSKILNERCLTFTEKLYGKRHFFYALSLNNLALNHSDLGDFQKAKELNIQCLGITKEIHGKEHTDYAMYLSDLASNYSDLGDFQNSKELNEQCLEIREKLYGKENSDYTTSLNNLASNYSDLGDYQKAKELNEQCLEITEKLFGKEHPDYITIQNNLALNYSHLGNYKKSKELNEESLDLSEKLYGIDHPEYAVSLNNLATNYYYLGDFVKSQELNEKCLNIREKLYGKEHTDYVFSLSNLAVDYSSLGDYQKSKELNEQCLKIYEKLYGKEHQDYIKTLNNLASNYSDLGNQQKSKELNEECLSLGEKFFGHEHPSYIMSLSNLASNYSELGNFKKSKELNEQCLKIREKLYGKDNPEYALSLNNLAFNYSELGNHQKSKELNEECLEIREKLYGKENSYYTTSINNLAVNYSNLGNYSKSKELNEQNLKESEILHGKEHPDYASSLNNLSLNYSSLGNYSKSRELAEECLVIYGKLYGENHPDYATCLANIAFSYSRIGEYTKSKELNNKSLSIIEKLYGKEHPKYIITLLNLAVNYSHLGDYQKSKELNEYCLKILQRINGKENPDYALIINNLALNYSKFGDYQKSKELTEQCLKIYEKLYEKDHPNYAVFLSNQSLNYFRLGEFIMAYKLMVKNFDSRIENYNKNKFGLNQSLQIIYKNNLEDNFYQLASITFSTNTEVYTLNNFWINLNGIIGSDQDRLMENISNSNDTILMKLFDDLKISKLQLGKWNEMTVQDRFTKGINTEDLESEIEKLESELSRKSKDFANSKREFELKDVKSNLSQEEVLIDIIRLPGYDFKTNMWNDSVKYLIFITDASNDTVPQFIVIDEGQELEGEIYSEYSKNTVGLNIENSEIDKVSYKHFWEPIADKIGEFKTVYVSLGGVYNNINLNTLFNTETEKYLFEEKDIRIVSNARDFVLNKEKEELLYTSNTVSLFGFPDYNGNSTNSIDTINQLAFSRDLDPFWIDSLSRGGMKASLLPGTKIEVENISTTFKSKGWDVNTFLKDDATESSVKQVTRPRVMHIATHGYFFENIPQDNADDRFMGMDKQKMVQDPLLRSGLLFSGANKTLQGERMEGENGLLSAYEASMLDLKETELVVLSACETGRGEVQNSEGVSGLRKAFADAGAQNIIMSLWKVDDKVTQEFMTTFYSNWLGEKSTIREAFNKTQLEIKAKYPQPYYWGAFILVGE